MRLAATEEYNEHTMWRNQRTLPDPALAVLGLLLLVQLAGRLEATRWTSELGLPSGVLLLGYGFGLTVGASRFRRRAAWALTLGYGSLLVPLALAWRSAPHADWPLRWLALLDRWQMAGRAFVAGRPVEDPILFLAVLSALAWPLGAWTGYALTRHRALWQVLLPPAGALWLIQGYDALFPQRSVYLYAYFVLALLYLARWTYLRRWAQWRRHRVLVPPDLGWDWLQNAFVGALLVGVLAWHIPAWARAVPPVQALWQQVLTPWRRVERRVGRALEGLRPAARLEPVPYAERLPLGTGVPLGDGVVFTVQAPLPLPGGRYYWRARAYTTYRRGVWRTVGARTLPQGSFTLPPSPADAHPVSFIVTLSRYAGNYYTDLYTRKVMGRPARALVLPAQEGFDPLAWLPPQALAPGSTYRLESVAFALDAERLRRAGEAYPPWLAPYLQVPDEVARALAPLAQELARQGTTPYDRARAVTAYLRAHMTYRNPIPPPPRNREPVLWFLFDAQEGFCNYYASAEVLLLRVMGIPARLAVGYAQGAYDRAQGRYVIRERDAHAWPEVYFPGVGWVPFEPTVSQPALWRPGDRDGVPLTRDEALYLRPEDIPRVTPGLQATPPGVPESRGLPPPQVFAPPAAAPSAVWLWLRRGVWLVLGLGVGRWLLLHPMTPRGVLALWQRLTGRRPGWLVRWARWNGLGTVRRAYAEINLALRLLGVRPPPGWGPLQRAEALAARVPQAAEPARLVAVAYARLTYAPPAQAVVAVRPVRRARRRLWWAVLWGWIRKGSGAFLGVKAEPPGEDTSP